MKKYYAVFGVIAVACVIVLLVRGNNNTPAPAKVVYSKHYVALGDSVAAGVGLKDYTDSSACDRTKQAYPTKLASSLQYGLQNVACSGATIPAGIMGPQNVNNLMVKAQLAALFAMPKPDLITLTIGANDAHWTQVIQRCYVAECGSDNDTAAVSASLALVKANITELMDRLQQQYGTAVPRVMVTGYHQVFPSTVPKSCTDLSGINAGEIAWGRQLQAGINTSISEALNGYEFATFVPIDFTGHELCTADPWVQGLSDNAPYHPNNVGQMQYAKQINMVIPR